MGVWQVHHRNPRASPSYPPATGTRARVTLTSPAPPAPVQAPRPSRPTSLTCTGPGKGQGAGSSEAVPAACLPESGGRGAGVSDFRSCGPQALSPLPGALCCCAPHTLLPAQRQEPSSQACATRPLPQGPHLGQKEPARDTCHPRGRGQKGEGAGPGL